MASLYVAKYQQFHDDSGDPLSEGKLTWTITTTTTAKSTYPTEADAIAGTNANVNPVVLDADGRSPVEIWINGRYRLRTYTSADVLIADDDPIEDTASGSSVQGTTSSYGGNNSGSADALVFTYSPAITSWTNGAVLRGRITGDNTGAVTVNNGGGVKTLVKRDGAALAAGDLQSPAIITYAYDSTTDVARLLDPTAVSLSAVRTYTASDTWTKPTGLAFVIVHVVGGGAAGGGASAVNGARGGGGGGGGYARKKIAASALAATETVTVGAGGTGVSAANGNAGGESSFSSTAVIRSGTAAGGQNGADATNYYNGSDGGTPLNGDLNIQGGAGLYGVPGATAGCSGYGGTAAGPFGGAGRRGIFGASNGSAGYVYGGGGAGASSTGSAQTGGAGAAGLVVVEEYVYS